MTVRVDGVATANTTFENFNAPVSEKAQSSVPERVGDFAEKDPNVLLAGANGVDRAKLLRAELLERTSDSFDFNLIQGVRNNPNVTPEFIREVVAMAQRLETRPVPTTIYTQCRI